MKNSQAINIPKRTKRIFIILLAVLSSTYPFVFNRFLPLPPIVVIGALMVLAGSAYIVKNKVHLDKSLIILAALQILSFVVSCMIHIDFLYIKQILYVVWGVIFIMYISRIGLKEFLFLFNRFILCIAILGAISFFLSLVFGPRSLLSFQNMDGRSCDLIYFTFSNFQRGNVIRYSGVFDEPGAMAYWGIFSLLSNHLYVKDSKLEIPLIISLIFTFSMAFFIQLALFIVFFSFERFSLWKKMVGLLAVFFLGYFVVMQLPEESIVYRLTIGRFMINETTGTMVGDNRSNLMEIARSYFYRSPIFGIGPTKFNSLEYMADNPFETLAKDGIFGTFFLYLPIVYMYKVGLKYKNIFFAALILSAGYLQRPFHIQIIHFVFIYIFFLIAKQYKLCSYQ